MRDRWSNVQMSVASPSLRGRSTERRRAFAARTRSLVSAVLILGLLNLSPGAPQFVMAQVQSTSTEARLAQLHRFIDGLEELRRDIDRTTFDVDALSFELAFEEPEQIVSWVRDAIGFEQYAGVLRGAAGTLMGRAGNAWDQALLLSGLLNDAGYQAHIVRGHLPDDVARLLLEEMARPTEPPPAGISEESVASALADLGAIVGMAPDVIQALLSTVADPPALTSTALYLEAAADTDFILAALHEAGALNPGMDARWAAMLEEASDYAWVQYRLGPDDPWTDAHPAFAQVPPEIDSLVVRERLETGIPDLLQHRVRIEAFIDQRLGDEVHTAAIMQPWDRPAANVIGIPITYTNLPDGIISDGDPDVDATIDRTRFFFPLLFGDFPEGAMAFDLLGNAVAAEAAASPMAGLFQSVTGKVVGGLSALAAMDAPETDGPIDQLVRLERQYLRITLIRPGGDESVYERMIGARGADDAETVVAVSKQVTLIFAVGSYSGAYVLDRYLAKLVSLRDFLASIVVSSAEGARPNFDALALRSVDPAWAGHLALFPNFDATGGLWAVGIAVGIVYGLSILLVALDVLEVGQP